MASNEKQQGRTALVFGASGITGSAIIREAIRYPSTTTFSHIIGMTNKPLAKSYVSKAEEDHRVAFVSGVDLTANVNIVTEKLRSVENIETVTDVYFAAYIQPPGTSDIEGFDILKEVNVKILETAVQAVESVCPILRFWSLQTGGKAYGFVHARKIGLPKVPCQESDPRIPQPYQDEVFYYAQHDKLAQLSNGKNWTFAEIRPDAVVGLVEGGRTAMNLAQTLGIFLAFYASNNGAENGKVKLPYPGPPAAFTARYTEVGQRTLARSHIFASTSALHATTEKSGNGVVYNVGDSASRIGTSWADKWASLCAFFGIEGVAPETSGAEEMRVWQYMHEHRDRWETWEKENQLVPGTVEGGSWEFLMAMLELAMFDRQYDHGKIAEAGFHEKQDIIEAYIEVFESMKATKMIPHATHATTKS